VGLSSLPAIALSFFSPGGVSSHLRFDVGASFNIGVDGTLTEAVSTLSSAT
jgi:hypothetical protein